MKRRINPHPTIAVAILILGCASEGSSPDYTTTATQAIRELEASDQAAVAACQDEVAACKQTSQSDGEPACLALANSCENLEQRLKEVRTCAVECWQNVKTCEDDECENKVTSCKALGESVGKLRRPVLECGGYVQACMSKAQGSGDAEMTALCKEMDAACGTGVAVPAVEKMMSEAKKLQQGSEPDTGDDDSEGDGTANQGEAAQTQQQDGEGDAVQAQQQDREGDAAEMQAKDGEGDAVQAQQQCLDKIAACAEASSKADAEPKALRQSEQACDLGSCG